MSCCFLDTRLFKKKGFPVPLQGFTLIELLVVFSVMAILSIIGIAAFVSYSHEQAINSAVLDVKNMLQTARADAQSQITVDSNNNPLCVNSSLAGYKVVICDLSQSGCPSGKTSGYELYPVCSSGTPVTVPVKSNELPPNISFDSTINSNNPTVSFMFNVLNGSVSFFDKNGLPEAVPSEEIGIKSVYDSKTRIITIAPDGSINVQ
ncbi:prepilin-type N-terminal cleavage/methylation domain-containing protein [Patescibacteria group bacterium]|nr:prepilin-type N-terminal cleavage/methylation domain-containing protein [Patescibacteria group bacterium]MCL5010327.1 prepilin-type N-terminal cleavage/methylation domain-containing protein [Patescibacteria group bacterium]